MTCPNCGLPLTYDAAISNQIEVRLTCNCGYSQPTETDDEIRRTLEVVGEYLRSPELIDA